MGWMIEESEFDSRKGQEIILFSTAFISDLEPNQPPNQWVTGGEGSFAGEKAAGM
jgi:hypothetical protein